MWPFRSPDQRVWQKREEQFKRIDVEQLTLRPVRSIQSWTSWIKGLVDELRLALKAKDDDRLPLRVSTQSIRKYLALFIAASFTFALLRFISTAGVHDHLAERVIKVKRGYLGKDAGRSHHWPGWSNIAHVYAFGDSHTDTGFRLDGDQPSDVNPLGNPAFPGKTSNYGPNYLGHLTGTFNESLIKTYNLATSGAIVTEREIFHRLKGDRYPRLTHWTLSNQVDYAFRSRYGGNLNDPIEDKNKGWHSNDTLFVLYPGNNELLEEYLKRIGKRNLTEVEVYVAEIERNLNHLYDYGARNFVVVNNACMEETPAIHVAGIIDGEGRFGAEMVDTNGRLAFAVQNFAEAHPEATVFLFDNYSLTIKVRLHPKDYQETKTVQKMEGFCYPYAERKEDLNTNDPLCGAPLDNWFWRDDEHITEPYHRLMARMMVDQMHDIENAMPLEFF